MHYKNGREAKEGDRVINLPHGIVGTLHSVNASGDACNGRISPSSQNDPYVTIRECLHMDDVAAASVPISTSKPAAT